MAPRLTVMINRKAIVGATVIRTSGSEGAFVDVRACAIGFFFSGGLRRALRAPKGERWFPTGRAVSAEGGVAVHRGDAKWSCPD